MEGRAGDAYPRGGTRATALWLLALGLGLLFPPVLPVIAIAMIAGGAVALRGARTHAARVTAMAVLAAGVVLLVVSVVLIAGLVSVDSGGGATGG